MKNDQNQPFKFPFKVGIRNIQSQYFGKQAKQNPLTAVQARYGNPEYDKE